ncbi:MAG: hypothetical protein AAF634_08690, partial [Bacteroidota bacterium]
FRSPLDELPFPYEQTSPLKMDTSAIRLGEFCDSFDSKNSRHEKVSTLSKRMADVSIFNGLVCSYGKGSSSKGERKSKEQKENKV